MSYVVASITKSQLSGCVAHDHTSCRQWFRQIPEVTILMSSETDLQTYDATDVRATPPIGIS